jgi:hypothetical protein
MFEMSTEQMLAEKFMQAVRLNNKELLEQVYSSDLLLDGGFHPIHYAVLYGTSETIWLLLRLGADPFQTYGFKTRGNDKDLDALDLALMYGKIENAECLYNNVEEFKDDESLSVCYYHVITKGIRLYQVLAINWLLQKSKDPNMHHSDDVYRPVHTAVQVKNDVALSKLLEDRRFNLCLTGNYHEPHGCLTPFQLALLYDNKEAAILLTEKCSLINLVDAKSSEGIDARQFAQSIGKLPMLCQWVRELPRLLMVSQQDSYNNLLCLNNLNISEGMDCGPPSFNFP